MTIPNLGAHFFQTFQKFVFGTCMKTWQFRFGNEIPIFVNNCKGAVVFHVVTQVFAIMVNLGVSVFTFGFFAFLFY